MGGYVVSGIIVFSVAVGVLMNSLRRGASEQLRAEPGAAVQDAPMAAVALDGHAVVRAWNRAAERMWRKNRGEGSNRNYRAISQVRLREWKNENGNSATVRRQVIGLQ